MNRIKRDDWRSRMGKWARELSAFWVVAGVFLAWTGAAMWQLWQVNGGHLTYVVDDAYIHLAMAKTWAIHGVWGVTAEGFVSSTSSPLWTALLAGVCKVFGVWEHWPWVLCIGFAVGCLWLVDRTGRDMQVSAPWRIGTGLAFVWLVPLVSLVATGMEHVMHLFWCLVMARGAAACLRRNRQESVWMLIGGMLATGTRYETLFLVAPLCVALAVEGRWRMGVALGALAWVPVVAYGWISVAHGAHFLPNSLLLKGAMPPTGGSTRAWGNFLTLGWKAWMLQTPQLFSLSMLVLVLCAWSIRKGAWRRAEEHAERELGRRWMVLAGGIWLVATWAHLQFAATGWFYRYEAYLVGLGVTGCGFGAWAWWRSEEERGIGTRTVGCLLVLFLVGPLGIRARAAQQDFLPAGHHIYRQQYQMGRFLAEAYGEEVRVAVNDLGAVSFFTDGKILDLYGLGTREVLEAKRAGHLDSQEISRLLLNKGITVVVVYDAWAAPLLPGWLEPVCKWTVPDGYWKKTVTFYGVGPSRAADLQKKLRAFAPKLPPGVEVVFVNEAGFQRNADLE